MAHLDLSDGKIKNVRAIIWREEGGKRLFLITQELSGHFTVPGGCKDSEDKDLETAIERELREEIGLCPEDYEISRIDWKGEYENSYHNPNSERYGKVTIIYPFLVHTKVRGPFSVQAGEIKDAVWLSADDARRALEYAPHMKDVFEVGLRQLDLG